MLSGRGRGSRERLSPTQHTGQEVRRGFLILVLSGLCRGRDTVICTAYWAHLSEVRRGFLTLVRNESSRGRHVFML